MAQFKTENQKRYKSYTDLRVPEKVRHDDNLKMKGDLETERSRDAYGQYSGGGRATPFRQTSKLDQHGDMDFSTEKTDNYKQHNNYSQVKGERPSTSLRPSVGSMSNYKTETQKR